MPAGYGVLLLATGTGSVALQWTSVAVTGFVTGVLACVHVTGETPAANFVATPRGLVALSKLGFASAVAGGVDFLRADRTAAWMTFFAAPVIACRVLLVADLAAAPLFGVASAGTGWLFAAEARDGNHFGAGGTGARVTEKQALVAAFWLEELAAHVAAGMRYRPWLMRRIFGFSAEAHVLSRYLVFAILCSAFWTVK